MLEGCDGVRVCWCEYVGTGEEILRWGGGEISRRWRVEDGEDGKFRDGGGFGGEKLAAWEVEGLAW